ncbi:M28 family peptidase [Balneola sp. MJW-20]|uniref:M28 family peptidase n=1 Tax=Gracilimonas aurantiaca TaxID=3234185 RepID=UPI0034665D32
MNKWIMICGMGIILSSCMSSPAGEQAKNITDESLMEHIRILSSDEFMGRGTGTEGEQMSVDYLVNEFKEMGAASGTKDGSFVQPFPLLGQKTYGADLAMIRQNVGSVLGTFNYYDDFVAWPANESERVAIEDAELVYVGYGIQAPEEDWDDFKEADVEGKILVIKNNDPEYDEDLFGGKTRLYYGRYTYKYEKAKEMGALGAIIIHTTPTAGYGWNVVSNSWSRERFYVKSAEGEDKGKTEFNGWITFDAGQKLFNEAGLDLEEMLEAADDPDFEPVALTGVGMNITLNADYRDINGKNVVAKIEGSDTELNDEYLILTAHFDHLGITTPVEGDSVNNGAEDNAAGVSALLEMMKNYKAIQPELKRGVIGLVVSAEEVGLLGSQYWAKNSTEDPGKITANINLDGMNVYGETRDLVVIGYGRNTMAELIEQVAEESGRTIKPDQAPENGIFYRSDHFNMAKIGIPAVFPTPGNEFVNKPEGFSSVRDSVKSANYHSVNDEINEYWDLSGAAKDARLLFEAGFRAINAPALQKWSEGDEFEAVRLEMTQN